MARGRGKKEERTKDEESNQSDTALGFRGVALAEETHELVAERGLVRDGDVLLSVVAV